MTCHEINSLLPGYLEGVLSPEEKKNLEDHLVSCPLCRRDLENLRGAVDLVKGLPEVEPPPFFEQRIMARVREEARRKKGVLRMLFFPLPVKIPIQAMATILIAVLAFYVFQKSQPEIRPLSPLPTPLTQSGKDRIRDEYPKTPLTPHALRPTKPRTAGDLPDKEYGQFAAAPPIETRERSDKKAEWPPPKRKEAPSMIKQQPPRMAEMEKDAPPSGTRLSDNTRGRAGQQDSGQAGETLEREQKLKGKMAEPGLMAEESRAMKSIPASPRFMAAPAQKRSEVDLTIQVRDTDVALREIEDRLHQTGGRIIEKVEGEGGAFLKVEITAQKTASFLKELEVVGKVKLDKNIFELPEGKTTVSIRIITSR